MSCLSASPTDSTGLRAAGITLIGEVDGALASVTGDAAYHTIAFYDAAAARGTRVVVPPTKTARVSRRRPRSSVRDRTIKAVAALLLVAGVA